MKVCQKKRGKGGIRKILELSDFHGLYKQLIEFRIDKGQTNPVLRFVQGLRFSARLTYIIRKRLSCYDLEVDWGHILKEDEQFCSPECDVIIHKPGYFERWDGDEKPVMDFKFIDAQNAVAVISCKSSVVTKIEKIDKEYRKRMGQYINNVYLFCECCPSKKVNSLKQFATSAGYKDFFYLYTQQEDTHFTEMNETVCHNFVQCLEQLGKNHRQNQLPGNSPEKTGDQAKR